MDSRKRVISRLKKELKFENAVLGDLEAIQRFVKRHRVEMTVIRLGTPTGIQGKYQIEGSGVKKFTWELENLIRHAQEMIHYSEEIIRNEKHEEAKGIPFRVLPGHPYIKRILKDAERKRRQAEKEEKAKD